MYWRIGIAFAVVVLAGISGYTKGYQNGKDTVQQAWDREKAELQAKYAEALKESIDKQQKLQMGADRLRKEKDAEIKNINARATALANSLQQRQTRPTETSTVPSVAGTGSNACTGAQLYRQDGEFLAGLAREADELVIALKQCYAQYESVRQTVK